MQKSNIIDVTNAGSAATIILIFLGLSIFLAIFIIQLIFFVKLWNMTNDVSEIKDIMQRKEDLGRMRSPDSRVGIDEK